VKGLLQMYIDLGLWDDAFALSKSDPSLNADLYFPYGQWLMVQVRPCGMYSTFTLRSDPTMTQMPPSYSVRHLTLASGFARCRYVILTCHTTGYTHLPHYHHMDARHDLRSYCSQACHTRQ
jgi:hypothetical protein